MALHQKSRSLSSLCNLCVLCVSVVCFCSEFINHRDTEDTEVAQRNPRTRTFSAKPATPPEFEGRSTLSIEIRRRHSDKAGEHTSRHTSPRDGELADSRFRSAHRANCFV